LFNGNENVVNISASDSENVKNIKTEIVDNKLSISIQKFSKQSKKTKTKNVSSDVKVKLIYKSINRIEQSGASTIAILDTIKTDTFYLKSSGASDVTLNIISNKLELNTSGASNLKLTGNVNYLITHLSGASDVKAGDLIAKNVNVNISGASDVTLYADSAISGTISGASDVHIKGNPIYRNLNNSGASSINGVGDNYKMKLGKNSKLDVEGENVDLNLGQNQVNVNDDTTKVKLFGYKLIVVDDSVNVEKIDKKRRNHWAGIDLGINGFANASGSLNLNNNPDLINSNPKKATQFMELNYAKSWTVSINFFEYFLKIKEHHFGVVTGLGLEWDNYELKHNVYLNAKGGNHIYSNVNEFNKDYTWGEVDTNFTYTKNRFKTFFINAPLMLEYNSGDHKNKSFHISSGAIFGMNLQTKTKYKYNNNGNDKKTKDKQSFNTSPFRVSLTTRIGYGWFNVFATYSLTSLFENNRGPELYPFTVGITLLGF